MSSEETPAIAFEAVSKTFGALRVLEGQTFEVRRGECLAILGPSGTGKSVTLKLIAGLLQPTSGHIRLLGQSLQEASSETFKALRRKMGFLFQSGALLGWQTLAENVALPLREHGRLTREDLAQRVQQVLEEVGLGEAGERYPAEVSGGMLKRAAFARAIIEDPEVLLFDEPTSGLDPVMARTIDDLIVQINRLRGAACVVVTHDLVGALRVAHRIAFLKGGRFLEVASPADFVRSSVPEVQAFLAAQQMEVPHG